MAMEEKSVLEKLKILLREKEFFTPLELLKMGLFGSKTTIHKAIKNKELESIWITERRVVIFRDSILKRVEKLINKREEEKFSIGYKKPKPPIKKKSVSLSSEVIAESQPKL